MGINKLLTLEEIEKIEKLRAEMIELEPEPCELGVWQVEVSRFNRYQLPNLLATASAYWEMKEQQTAELVEIGKQDNNKPHDAIELATFMHDFYEDASAKAGWETQKKCRVPFSELPENNQFVMIRMANALIKRFAYMSAPTRLPELADNKPHAPTIRTVIEALKEANQSYSGGDVFDIGIFIQSLDSILKDL